jgi:hypothetical protein
MLYLPTKPRTPADSVLFSQNSNPEALAAHARAFVAETNALVDEIETDRDGVDVVEYLKRQHPAPTSLPQALPHRFKREPDIFLPNVRFSRLRRFLSRFIGDLAYFGWRAA